MQVLIVDCNANDEFKIFSKMVKASLRKYMHGDGSVSNFITRQLDQLSDYTCHWHHDTLDEKSKGVMCKFDKIDIICICGDMNLVPWDPMYMQVVTLIFMAYHCKKPVYCCGSAAYAAIYTVATEGTRFHVLNGPNGDSLSTLPKFPRYSVGTGPFPSGWLDNHTGDIYLYDKDRLAWIPSCNIAMYRIATSGRPTHNKYQPTSQHYAREDRQLLSTRRPEAVEYTEELCFVQNKYLQHYSVKNLQCQDFVATPLQEWHLQNEGALPPNVGMQAVASCSTGPVIVSCGDTMLMVAIDMTAKSGVEIINITLNNFIEHSVAALRGNIRGINTSLFVYIFGEHGLGGGTFDSVADIKPRSPPLSTKMIKSRLARGPAHLDTPVYGMFFKEVDPGTFDLTALMSPRASSSLGRVPVNVLRDPQMNHAKRLGSLLQESGYRGLDKVCAKAIHEGLYSDPMSGAFLDSTKAAMSGRIIHTNNIRGRRMPTIRQGDSTNAPIQKGTVRGATTFMLASPAERGDKNSSSTSPVHMNMGIFANGNSTMGQTGSTIEPANSTSIAESNALPGLSSTGATVIKNRISFAHQHPEAHHAPIESRRPSSANAALLPKQHPKIRKPSEAVVTSISEATPKPPPTIYFVDDDEEGGDADEIAPTRPPRPIRASSAKFVQPSRTVYISQKSQNSGASTSRKLSALGT